MLFGECVHARAGGKVVRRLGATVQHNDQRERLPTITAGNVELVGAASSSVAKQPRHGTTSGSRAGDGWATPPMPGAERSRLTRSRKLRRALGMCGRAVPSALP